MVTQKGCLLPARSGVLRNDCRRYPAIMRKYILDLVDGPAVLPVLDLVDGPAVLPVLDLVKEHERTPGEVAVMWIQAQGHRRGCAPSLMSHKRKLYHNEAIFAIQRVSCTLQHDLSNTRKNRGAWHPATNSLSYEQCR